MFGGLDVFLEQEASLTRVYPYSDLRKNYMVRECTLYCMRDECVRRGHHDHKSSNLQTSKPPSLQASRHPI